MTPPSNVRCLSCGLELTADRCSRCGRPRVLSIDYLSKMEDLARQIVRAALDENSFDVFARDDSGKSPLQKSISRAANELLYWHYQGDGCVHDPEPAALIKEAAELSRLLLAAIDRIDDEAFRRDWGTRNPSPGDLILEGLSIARRAIDKVPFDAPDFLDAVVQALKAARDQQAACGTKADRSPDENGYILSGIEDAIREAEKLKNS